MNTRASIARRLVAFLGATALVAALALAWDLRPSLPTLPRSFSAPLPASTISRTLDLAAWVVFVLLDLVLLTNVMKFAIRRTPRRSELKLKHAFAAREKPTVEDGDWRRHSGPLARPVLLIPTRHDAEPRSEPMESENEVLREVPPAHAIPRVGPTDDDLGLKLLGPFELTGCKKKQPRRQATSELLAYLAIQRRPVSRDELLEALWPGDDPKRSASRFYQAASEARKLLGDAFVRERDTYNLHREQLQIDLDELDQLREQTHGADKEQTSALIERALALFRGDPLAGIEALWAGGERRRLTALRADLLERAGRLSLESGDATRALELAEKAAALDALNERPVQLAIEAEAALGRREAVVERYERLRRDLDEGFGLEPSRGTKLLYRRLLGQDADRGTGAGDSQSAIEALGQHRRQAASSS
jgi:DNA-binding SARP family transcriptional activator